MQDIRFATVGSSLITERFIDSLHYVEGAQLVGSYSRDIERARAFGEKHGATLFFDDLASLGSCDEIDAVYIASPNMAHCAQATLLAEAGKHVIIEKSLGSNVAEARRVFAAAHEAGVVAMEAMRNIHGPGFAAIEKALSQVGVVRQASIRLGKRTSRMPRLLAGERLAVFDPRFSSGSLMDIGVYCVEPAIALFGTPSHVDARLITIDVPDEPADGNFARIDIGGELLLSYADEQGRIQSVINVSYGKTCDGLASSEVQGESGTVLWDETSEPRNVRLVPAVEASYGFAAEHGEVQHIDVEQLPNDMACEVADFCRAIRAEQDALALVDRCEQVTIASLAVMDEARIQAGVRFPADLA